MSEIPRKTADEVRKSFEVLMTATEMLEEGLPEEMKGMSYGTLWLYLNDIYNDLLLACLKGTFERGLEDVLAQIPGMNIGEKRN